MIALPSLSPEPFYTDGALRDGAGELLRPGGMGLTAEAVDCGGWRPGDRVIDVGCGWGSSLDLLQEKGLKAIGVDISERILSLARQRPGKRIVLTASGDALPFADDCADGILAECSLSLMPNPAEAMAEFSRVLRPGGRLVVTDVYRRAPSGRQGVGLTGCLSGILDRDTTIRRMEHAGLALDAWEDRSDLLKAFIARFIFEHGSLEALWGGCAGAEAVRMLRPGYVLLVAHKKPRAPGSQSVQLGRTAHG